MYDKEESQEKYYKELTENMVHVRLDIRELMTEVRSLKSLQETVSTNTKNIGKHDVEIEKLETQYKSVSKRTLKIENLITWVSRIIVGTVLLAVLYLVVSIKGGS